MFEGLLLGNLLQTLRWHPQHPSLAVSHSLVYHHQKQSEVSCLWDWGSHRLQQQHLSGQKSRCMKWVLLNGSWRMNVSTLELSFFHNLSFFFPHHVCRNPFPALQFFRYNEKPSGNEGIPNSSVILQCYCVHLYSNMNACSPQSTSVSNREQACAYHVFTLDAPALSSVAIAFLLLLVIFFPL